MCQNSPFIEITLATTFCGEGDFYMRVSTQPLILSDKKLYSI